MNTWICPEYTIVTWLAAIGQRDKRSGAVDLIFIDLSPAARSSRARQ